MNKCRADIDTLVQELIASKAHKPDKDTIATAQKIFNCEHKVLIVPIVQRLKTVLQQVLKEEITQLDRKVSELRRSGYHEDEAYTISDRVEVIVKALRQAW